MASAVVVDPEAVLPSVKQMTFSESSLVVKILSKTSSTMISWVADLEEECKCNKNDPTEEINREETHLEAWASVEDSLMMTMDSDLEEEACSNRCRWEVVWEAAWEVEGLVLSNLPHFQVEVHLSQ